MSATIIDMPDYRCPKCGSPDYSTELRGCLGALDTNRVTCHDCGWSGEAHEMGPILRDGRESDIPGAALAIQALTGLGAETVDELVSVFVSDASDRARFWRVAEAPGRGLVGSLAAVMDDDGDVWVMSQWSVEGFPFVSAALYRELLRWVKRQPEAHRIVTSAPDDDTPAGRFFDAAGFREAGQVQAPLLGAPQERWMVKEVRP